MSRKGTVTIERNGHTLVITIGAGDRRYFACATMGDLAEKYDGATDPGPALDEFEQRATAAPPDPAPVARVRQPSLFDAMEEGVAAAEACAGNAERQGWDADAAAAFIVAYLARHGPTAGEVLVSEAARANEPHDARAFGAVFLKLKRANRIEPCGFVQRRKGHGTAGGRVWRLVAADVKPDEEAA